MNKSFAAPLVVVVFLTLCGWWPVDKVWGLCFGGLLKPQKCKLISELSSSRHTHPITPLKVRGSEDETLERSQEECPLQTGSFMVHGRLLFSVHFINEDN